FDVAGEPTRAGSKVLADAPAASNDAPVVRRLRAAGSVIIAKTNMTEFAFSIFGANPHYGTPGNPADRTRVPGGSSGGVSVAVAPLRMGVETLPSDLATGTTAEVEEERRLLSAAMRRARDHLRLIVPQRFGRGRWPDARQELDNAKPRHAVARVLRPSQKREHVLDVRGFKEFQAAEFDERDVASCQLHL